DDPRKLWQVPEARRFFARLWEAGPHALFFLCPEPENMCVFIAMRLTWPAPPGGRFAKRPRVVGEALIAKSTRARDKFCQNLGINRADKRLSELAAKNCCALAIALKEVAPWPPSGVLALLDIF